MKTIKKLWIGLLFLILLTPLGLIVPAFFKTGDAWGEWGTGGIKELIGYVPKGLEKLSNLWNAPLPDYAFKGWEEKGLPHMSFAYILSALLGIAVIVAIMLMIGKFLSKKGQG